MPLVFGGGAGILRQYGKARASTCLHRENARSAGKLPHAGKRFLTIRSWQACEYTAGRRDSESFLVACPDRGRVFYVVMVERKQSWDAGGAATLVRDSN